MPAQQNKPLLFEILTREEKPRSMVVLFLILVIFLHGWLVIWLIKPQKPITEIQPLIAMEIALVAAPVQPPAQPPTPPKPVPAKKPPVKKAVPKKTPVIKKPVELPKPQPVIEEKLPTLPSEAPVKANVTEVKPVSKFVENVSHDRINRQNIVSGVVPLVRVQPKYPSRALNRHIEGWVKIEFTISSSGEVTDETVVASEPAEIFDYEALKAIKKWKFKVRLENGLAIEQRAIQTLQFKLIE